MERLVTQISKNEMLRRYSSELASGNASLFAGAGLSRAAGFVDWKMLLQEIAADLGLDIARESDLLAIAQYHVNERTGRGRLNQLLIEEFNRDAALTPNHRLLATLGLRSIWTTNYDELIEQAFREVRKRPDVKTTTANLAQSLPGRDVIVYKMHGDCSQPQEAVLTKEDYEIYDDKRGAFSTVLKGELIEKSFLFVGFSFTDPNIDWILSRIRGLLGQNQRDHYCIMKWPELPELVTPTAKADFEYEKRKLELRINDLSRYRIHALMIDSYSEITQILQDLNARTHLKDIFVSGSASDYGPLGFGRIDGLLRLLGSEIVKRGFTLISGFGLGIGSAVSYGALHEVYSSDSAAERVRLMPFPQEVASSGSLAEFHSRHREAMISLSGFSIFICGNKAIDGPPALAAGVFEEFAISCKAGKYPIPLGATGWAAKKIWDEVISKPEHYYGKVDVARELKTLDDTQASDSEYIESVFSMIRKLS